MGDIEDGYRYYDATVKGGQKAIEDVKHAFNWPSCENCKFACWMEDRSVGIHLHVEDCRLGFPGINEESDEIPEDYVCERWEINWNLMGPSW